MNAGEIVESSEDILIEILILLPPKSIFRFMCVSKRWKNIIENPFFLRSYSLRRRSCSDGGRLLAFFQKTGPPFCHSCTALPTHGRRPINMLPTTPGKRIKHIPRRFGRFITSSSGLILCSPDHNTYHVLNPVTQNCVTLPPPQYGFYYTSVGLMCEENVSELAPNYTVIRAYVDEGLTTSMQIQTYSSKTRQWSQATLMATEEFKVFDEHPMVANGVFHWRAYHTNVVVHDLNDDHQNNHVQLIQLPSDYICNIGRSRDDMLWSGTIESGSIKLWMLPKGEDGSYKRATAEEWVLMHDISCPYEGLNNIDFFSWDPLVLLLYKNKRLFLYNVETKSFKRVRHRGRLVSGEFYDVVSPLLESFFLSSYAL